MGDHINYDQTPMKEPPKTAEEQSKEGPQLLGGVLNPVGDGLGKVLRPIGKPVETITKPLADGIGGSTRPFLGPLTGEKKERLEAIGGDNKDSYEHKPEKIAGKEQTGENPLGLDNTGRWGFRDED